MDVLHFLDTELSLGILLCFPKCAVHILCPRFLQFTMLAKSCQVDIPVGQVGLQRHRPKCDYLQKGRVLSLRPKGALPTHSMYLSQKVMRNVKKIAPGT